METAAHPRFLFKPRTFGMISVTLKSSASLRTGVVKTFRCRSQTKTVAIRTKGRASFDYNGRAFVWHVADEFLLRIASTDKQFSVAYELVGNNRLLAVGGPEFIGIPKTVSRPTWIVPPEFSAEIGGRTVREILDWCFDPNHEIVPYDGPPGSTVQRAWDSLDSDS